MFSGNRKVRSRRPKTAQELKHAPAAQIKSTRQLSRRSEELSSQIHRLECYLTDVPRLERQQRLANVNMVPPMDLPSPALRQRRVPIAQQRAQRARRLRLCVETTVVISAIAALAGWMNQWFHFWG